MDIGGKFSLKGAVDFSESDVCNHPPSEDLSHIYMYIYHYFSMYIYIYICIFIIIFLGELGLDWNEQVSYFFFSNFRWGSWLEIFSCLNRCGSDERNAETIASLYDSHSVRCFCDKLCVELGDCCFDFSRR